MWFGSKKRRVEEVKEPPSEQVARAKPILTARAAVAQLGSLVQALSADPKFAEVAECTPEDFDEDDSETLPLAATMVLGDLIRVLRRVSKEEEYGTFDVIIVKNYLALVSGNGTTVYDYAASERLLEALDVGDSGRFLSLDFAAGLALDTFNSVSDGWRTAIPLLNPEGEQFRANALQQIDEALRLQVAEHIQVFVTGQNDLVDVWLALLHVDRNAGQEELHTAYRTQIKIWHPDRLHGMAAELQHLAETRTSELNEAYQGLLALLQKSSDGSPSSSGSR